MNPVRAEMLKYPGEIDKIRKTTNVNFALGGERFIAEVGNVLAHRVTPGKAGRPRKMCEN
jgi:putative transposase